MRHSRPAIADRAARASRQDPSREAAADKRLPQFVAEEVARFNDHLGLRERVRSLDYFRCAEYPLVTAALALEPGLGVLDMGCGSGPYGLFLAARREALVQVLDIDVEALAWQRRGAQRLALSPRSFAAVHADSRAVPFGEQSFDRILNLGSIEHIRGDGDSLAAVEMARVLRPGGLAVLVVPYGRREEEIDRGAHVEGFERRYDDAALQRRLIGPSGLEEIARVYYGEPGFRTSSVWYATPRWLRLPIRRLARRLSSWSIRTLPAQRRGFACGVCVTLRRAA